MHIYAYLRKPMQDSWSWQTWYSTGPIPAVRFLIHEVREEESQNGFPHLTKDYLDKNPYNSLDVRFLKYNSIILRKRNYATVWLYKF